MSSPATSSSSDAEGLRLTDLARAGFSDLSAARGGLGRLAALTGRTPAELLTAFGRPVGQPDESLTWLCRIAEREPDALARLLASPASARRVAQVTGGSAGLAEFLLRRPEALEVLAATIASPRSPAQLLESLLASVVGEDGVAARTGPAARRALRVAYRRELTRLAAWDLEQPSGTAVFEQVAAALSDLAAAALEGALRIARAEVASSGGGDRAAAVPLAIIGMGKAGARELNYVSDVDVIFVTDRDPASDVDPVPVATRLAITLMRVIDDADVEPALWQVDANLRPEGRSGALVRTLASHVGYYDRWASGWEFQALLKAWPLAGDPDLGRRYVEAVRPKVW